MSDETSVSRRQFVAATIVAAALPLLSTVPWVARTSSGRFNQAAGVSAQLAAVLRSRTSAVVIGEAYLAAYPGERDAAHLGNLIAADVDTRPLLESLAPEQLGAVIGAIVQRDFALGRTVEIDGWLLARTEARLCALTALA
jgi:hypothetical protein